MKIVVDAMGGDNAPYEVVKGVVDGLKKYDNLNVILCGDKEKVEKFLSEFEYDKDRIEVVHAPEIIGNNESPTKAIREKTNSSLVVAFDVLKKDEDVIGMVSAGSTGAILTGGFMKIGRLEGISRPALSPFLPTRKGGNVLIIDCGANVDCKPLNLCHFAIMGSEYFKERFGVEKPRVALLNIGTEQHKGNELCHVTYPLLEKLDINFVGNMEARDLMSGDYDVVVADGFAGNILLKSTEGAVKIFMKEMKSQIRSSFWTKIGGFFMLKVFKNLKKKYDFDLYGGAPFIGCKKLIIKAHGSSKAKSIETSIDEIITLHNKKLNKNITKALEKVKIEESE
ncbi:MAG: phosphate acyltransferase PlsX [Clostridia bacterium]|nr:phosphate acyltransferase PlsX [Clostridia bacterium]